MNAGKLLEQLFQICRERDDWYVPVEVVLWTGERGSKCLGSWEVRSVLISKKDGRTYSIVLDTHTEDTIKATPEPDARSVLAGSDPAGTVGQRQSTASETLWE